MPRTGDAKPDTEWLSSGEAAREIGVAVETLRRWEREGKITPTRTLGGHRRFHRDDLSTLRTGRVS